MKMLQKWSDETYALLRIASGLMFSFHGLQKTFGILTSNPQPAAWTQMWFGGLIELVCGIAVAIGLWARPAAFLASGTMLVAYAQFHWKFQTGEKFFPIVNQGELAMLYCVVFLFIACKGSGKWGVGKD